MVPAGGVTGGVAGAGAAGQALRMNGAGAGGPGGGGICGRPTSDVDHVATHRSADCACDAGSSVPAAYASTIAETAARTRLSLLVLRLSLDIKSIPFFCSARVLESLTGSTLDFSQFVIRPPWFVMEQPQLLRAAASGKMRAL